jgi:hypothetical protein
MAAPEYVPVKPLDDVRAYESPPRRPDPWRADRPGDLPAGQPHGSQFGSQGPDQGYALRLARLFRDQIRPGRLSVDDVIGGALGLVLERGLLYGRAPVAKDWKVALDVFGFLDDDAPPDLVARREELFMGVAHAHHDAELRRIVESVPEEALR